MKGWYGDKQQHSMASRGVRTGNIKIKANGKKHEFVDELPFHSSTLRMFEKEYGEIESVSESDRGYEVVTDEGTYLIYDEHDNAIWDAQDYEESQLEDSVSGLPDWLIENHMYISPTDRRIMAGEQADYQTEDLSESEIISLTDSEDEYDNLDEKITEKSEEFETLDDRIEGVNGVSIGEDEIDNLYDKKDEVEQDIKTLEKEREQLLDTALESLQEEIYDEWYEGLKDPMGFLVEQQGLYSKEDLVEQNFISINYNEMAKEIVRSDGVGNTLARYDGNEGYISNENNGDYIYIYQID